MTGTMSRRAVLATASMALLGIPDARAQETTSIEISLKSQQFEPAEIRAPANKALVLKIKNLDAKAMEFESKALRVEKVVPANGEGVVNLRPLKPGRYTFIDDFNPKAKGTLIVE